MVLCAAAALGTHSRGSFLALLAMGLLLWWRGKSRIGGGILIAATGLALVAFMPEVWTERMMSIQDYDKMTARPWAASTRGGRRGTWRSITHSVPASKCCAPEMFERYSPNPEYVHAAHSIYFLVLGQPRLWRPGPLPRDLDLHLDDRPAGFGAKGPRCPKRNGAPNSERCAKSRLLGFAVGGAFLSLSYFDLPYDIMALVVLTRVWLTRRAWESERLGSAARAPTPELAPVAK